MVWTTIYDLFITTPFAHQLKEKLLLCCIINWNWPNSPMTVIYHFFIQKIRPSLEEIPEDIAPLLQSCWAEDPSGRPEFTEVTDSLCNLLQTFVLRESGFPNMVEQTEEVECASDTSSSLSKRQHKAGRSHRNSSSCLKCCYNYCLSD